MWKHISTTIRELMDAAYAAKNVFEELAEAPSDLKRFQIQEPDYWTTTHYLRLCERADWTGAPFALRVVVGRAIERMRKMGFPMYVHTVWRDPAVQLEKYNAGHSKLKSGAHQRSLAADVVHAHYHWVDASTKAGKRFWDLWGVVLKESAAQEGIIITWGGDWSFYDPAHVEISGWQKFEEIKPHASPERIMPRKLLRDCGVAKPKDEEINGLWEKFNAYQ
jgi:hypothetical protein